MGWVALKAFHDDEDAVFITYIYPERVKDILKELKVFDIEKALMDFEPETFARENIYPMIWVKEEIKSLREELSAAFLGMKEFFESMEERQTGAIVSIY